jgi:hypothetical protein
MKGLLVENLIEAGEPKRPDSALSPVLTAHDLEEPTPVKNATALPSIGAKKLMIEQPQEAEQL